MFQHVTAVNGKIDFSDTSRIRFIPFRENNSGPVTSLIAQLTNAQSCCAVDSKNCAMVLKHIPVTNNALYRLKLDTDILWSSNEELAPEVMVHIRSGAWHHCIERPIKQADPIVHCDFLVPRDVSSLEICLLVHIVEPNNYNFQIALNVLNCELQVAQENVCSTVHVKRSLASTSSMLSLFQQCYLIHVPSTPLNHVSQLEHQLGHQHGIAARLLVANDASHNVDDDAIWEHDTEVVLESTIEALTQAMQCKYESILLLRDDVALHRHWNRELQVHLDQLPEHYSVLLLGSMFAASTTETKEEKTILPWIPVQSGHVYSSFAIVLRGQSVMQATLEHLARAKQQGENPFLGFHQFALTKFGPNACYVWQPNLIVLHPEHSHHRKILETRHAKEFGNFNSNDSVHYWRPSDYGPCNYHSSPDSNLPFVQARTVNVLMLLTPGNGGLSGIRAQIESIRQQTYPYWKLHIVSPDSMSQSLEDMLEDEKDFSRIKLYSMRAKRDNWMDCLNNLFVSLNSSDLVTFCLTGECFMPKRLNDQMHTWWLDARFSQSPLLKMGTAAYFPTSDLCVASLGVDGKLCHSSLLGTVFTVYQGMFQRIYRKLSKDMSLVLLLQLMIQECPRLYTVPQILVHAPHFATHIRK